MTRPRPDPIGDTPDAMRDMAAKHGSQRLLVAQIRSGQHSLTGEALARCVAELRAMRLV